MATNQATFTAEEADRLRAQEEARRAFAMQGLIRAQHAVDEALGRLHAELRREEERREAARKRLAAAFAAARREQIQHGNFAKQNYQEVGA